MSIDDVSARQDHAESTAVTVLLAMLADDEAAARAALEAGQVFDTPDDAQIFVTALGRLFLDLARHGYRGDDGQIREYLLHVGGRL